MKSFIRVNHSKDLWSQARKTAESNLHFLRDKPWCEFGNCPKFAIYSISKVEKAPKQSKIFLQSFVRKGRFSDTDNWFSLFIVKSTVKLQRSDSYGCIKTVAFYRPSSAVNFREFWTIAMTSENLQAQLSVSPAVIRHQLEKALHACRTSYSNS